MKWKLLKKYICKASTCGLEYRCYLYLSAAVVGPKVLNSVLIFTMNRHNHCRPDHDGGGAVGGSSSKEEQQ